MDASGSTLKPQVSELLEQYAAVTHKLFAKLQIETAAEGVKTAASSEANSAAACMKSLVSLDEQLQDSIAKMSHQQTRQREIEKLDRDIAEKDIGLQHMANNLVQAEEMLSTVIDKANLQITDWKAASTDAATAHGIVDYAHRTAFTDMLPPFFREGDGPFHCFPTEEHMHFSKVFDRPPEAAADPAVVPAEPTAAKVGDKRPASAVDTEELIKKNSQPLVSPPVTTPRAVPVQLGGFGMDSDSDSDSDSD